ncbi:MAG: hypothetical protein EPN69_13080 [Rhodanobacter sp.]|nr:MAG: hypothetical protein EPN69_13080 [Rhodanobacter sp.]TAM01209.1 MAG: hypothetical protein EPN71_05775 [Rhodanobacter sp.]TAM38647.1 MAG: hypothetical protein EPN58_16245 [Rhodanobacter sp.]TAN23672.1 MAG: hypothetical protein EPN32_10820 [Rhodanobacter sp.]
MPQRPLGNSTLLTSPLVLGSNVFGWNVDEKRAFDVLDAFVDAGGNLIDTADSYSAGVPGNRGGESETIIGKWLKRSGKFRSAADLAKSTVRGGAVKKFLNPHWLGVLAALDAVAATHHATPAQVALAWLMARPGLTAPIASATSVKQLDELMGATLLHLEQDEVTRIDQAARE